MLATFELVVTILTLLDFPIPAETSERNGYTHLLDATMDMVGDDTETLARHFAVALGVYQEPEDVDLFWSHLPQPREVVNLATGERVNYFLSAFDAVVAAYAQHTRKDWNTWTYTRYHDLVLEGQHTFLCGDWSVLKTQTH